MEKDYPYAAEYAKSGRASCKSCKTGIGKDSLRMAVMVQSHHFDGKIPNWFHFDCFFKKSKLRNLDEIKNLDSLRWEDQEKIKSKIDVETDVLIAEFSIEYAKSNRSKCGKCDKLIEKSEIRFSMKENQSKKAKLLGGLQQWHHIDCLQQMKEEVLKLNPNFNIDKVTGFNSLIDADKQELIQSFSTWKSKKRSKSNKINDKTENKKTKLENESDEQLKIQNKYIWNIRDKLSNEIEKNELVNLLEYNNQFVPIGEANLLNAVSDCMAFGCLNCCPDCGGMLSYSSNNYKCQSMVNEWTKCLYHTRDVIRTPFKIPKEYLHAEVLRSYTYKSHKRILPVETKEIVNDKPLVGCIIGVDAVDFGYGYTQDTVKQRIKFLGGKIATNRLLNQMIMLISSKSAFESESEETPLIKKAKMHSIDVVTVNLLDNLNTGSVVDAVKKYSISQWGHSKNELMDLIKNQNITTLDKFTNNDKDNIQVFKVKGGAAVDPDSKLEKKAHLYQEPKTGDPLNAVLGMADLVRGTNSFYKVQLLESDKTKKWWVFRSWGRIGTVIGSNKLELFDDLQDAIANFKLVYLDKTGNEWENRKKFQKKPNKFSPLDMDYGEDAKNINQMMENTNSKMAKSLQDLIRFIFDMESMKKAMLEFEIDLTKMPLGKLSKKQIDISYNLLKEIQQVLNETGSTQSKLLELSNKFYTMMPHDFGMRRPPLIDSLAIVKEKCEMIESLLEMEVAYKLMKIEDGNNSIDGQYKKLNNRIEPLAHDSEEFQRLSTYLQNTHAPTHNDYVIIIKDIYNVDRDGETNRFHSFKKLPNRMVLWHGSRRMNWAGILSQGLRVAPPEAPVTGYMFGKGLYFADMVSKSANYCHTSSESPDGLLLLCEVALGTITERYKADEKVVLKKGEHSCKGVGKTIPDPVENYIDEEGIVYPMGKPIKQKVKSDLLYNEYIVYDIGQVRQKYLFKVKFDYKKIR